MIQTRFLQAILLAMAPAFCLPFGIISQGVIAQTIQPLDKPALVTPRPATRHLLMDMPLTKLTARQALPTDMQINAVAANINHLFYNRVTNAIEVHADQPLLATLNKDVVPDGRHIWRLTINQARWGLTLPSQSQLRAEINRVWPGVDLVHYKTLDQNRVQLVMNLPKEINPTLRMSGVELTLQLDSATVAATKSVPVRVPVLMPVKSPSVALTGNPVLDPRHTAAQTTTTLPTQPLVKERVVKPVDTQPLQTRNQQLTSQLQQQQLLINQLKAQLAARPNTETLNNNQQALQTQLASLRQQLSEAMASRQLLVTQHQALQAKVEDQAKALQAQQNRVQQQTTLETELATAKQQAIKLQGDLQTAQQQLTAAQTELKSAQQQLTAKQTDQKTAHVKTEELAKLTQQLAEAQAREKALQTTLTQEKTDKAALQASLTKAQTTIDTLQKQVAAKPTADPAIVATLNREIRVLQEANANLTQRVKALLTPRVEPAPTQAVTNTAAIGLSSGGVAATPQADLTASPVTAKPPVATAAKPLPAKTATKPTKVVNKPANKPAKPDTVVVSKPVSAGKATADKRWLQALSETDFNQANRLWMALIKDYPNDSEPVHQLADRQAGQGNWAQAVKTLQGFLAAHPDDQSTFEAIGMVYLKAERWADAKLAFGRVTNTQPVVDYGLQLKQSQKLPQAEMVLKLATELDPLDATRQFHLGNVYSAQQKLPDAKAAYLQAMALRNRFAEASYNLGIILSKLGDQPGAIARLENYLEWSPSATNTQAVQQYIDRLKAQSVQ
jgi:Flp pilus assembly protein TadD